jgi:hypothetical protein
MQLHLRLGLELSTTAGRLISFRPARSARTCFTACFEPAPHRPAQSAPHLLSFPAQLIHKLGWQSNCYVLHARHTCIVPHCCTRSNGLSHRVPHESAAQCGHMRKRKSQTTGQSLHGQPSRDGRNRARVGVSADSCSQRAARPEVW